jgi:hypothetical protein
MHGLGYSPWASSLWPLPWTLLFTRHTTVREFITAFATAGFQAEPRGEKKWGTPMQSLGREEKQGEAEELCIWVDWAVRMPRGGHVASPQWTGVNKRNLLFWELLTPHVSLSSQAFRVEFKREGKKYFRKGYALSLKDKSVDNTHLHKINESYT